MDNLSAAYLMKPTFSSAPRLSLVDRRVRFKALLPVFVSLSHLNLSGGSLFGQPAERGAAVSGVWTGHVDDLILLSMTCANCLYIGVLTRGCARSPVIHAAY